ncbi:UDP-N-acetylmuramoyl-L-alanyl-D-glutamate--2,6-diaminopimelate ligase [Lujinxingia sediminis]|uniref:UDP-N-acetylmuramoyl-L-alanyl-D-glutamate--2,6-diaminopimelate ligase n=1 Tax=Lujinxingia sediminis TaxID=2480984 RepID=A0ABY0CXK2_9DELT|nr:UDP-N-acetylmuramoyl-L-alanyl-D-glutamate--2,6-diaminopimelate ligase [Lujinxingia sediminis]RVU48617.1 UDP-N-acetylmuramoyl-L-alanyl-D-glutamate--2,6-diaminopimelate ligase [Lujinxingia sediminis]
MKLNEVVQALKEQGVRLRSGAAEVALSALTQDSRQVSAGTLFVAVRGEHFDGHAFVEKAIAQGAAAVLVDDDYDTSALTCPVLSAPDTRAILGHLGAAFYAHPSRALDVVGVTGTNGKTTVSYLVEAIAREAGREVGVIGTINNRWKGRVEPTVNTTPDGLALHRRLRDMADDGVDLVIMEISSHGLALGRVDGVAVDVAIFTNLTRDHLDFHKTMEAYRDAKRLLFTRVLPQRMDVQGVPGAAIINIDDVEGKTLAALLSDDPRLDVTTYGASKGAVMEHNGRAATSQLRATDVQMRIDGTSLTLASPDAELPIETSLHGEFNVSNILAAAGAAHALGIADEAIAAGLRNLSGVRGRLQRVEGPEGTPAVFVDYAHTPDALERVLTTLRPMVAGRLRVVFGAGGDRDRDKRAPMGRIASELADHVIITSDNPRSEEPGAIVAHILQGVLSRAGLEVEAVVDRQAAIENAVGNAAPDDVVLIAGKGHETYQEIAGVRRHFDDAALAAALLKARAPAARGRS